MFRNREDAARQLAQRLHGRKLVDPLVLAIPRGGVPIGAELARELDADLDVVLARKLRAPGQPELALGAVSEKGEMLLAPHAQDMLKAMADYLDQERQHQLAEIARRKSLFRAILPQASVAGRSVIVTDDGIATGSTMIAALQVIKPQGPRELIVAVPIVAAQLLQQLWTLCDEVVFLHASKRFWAIGQFYGDFRQVDDAQVYALLRSFSPLSTDERQPSKEPPSHYKRSPAAAFSGTSKEEL